MEEGRGVEPQFFQMRKSAFTLCLSVCLLLSFISISCLPSSLTLFVLYRKTEKKSKERRKNV